MQKHLGIGACGERVSAALQVGTEFDEVENFPIEYDPERSVLITDGLLAGTEIDNAETVVA